MDGHDDQRAPGVAGSAPRKIIHVDMDAFFASVEQRDDPRLRGKPVAVGGSRERGVVAAASYEARRYGVRSAMPSVTARRKCPHLIFVPTRFEVYREVSAQTREIFADYTTLVEPPSLDEAYLDVTENLKGMPLARDVAREIRGRILEVTGLTASAGISYNKFLAKMGSDMKKPNGQYTIPPERGPAFVGALAIERFHGVGESTASKMRALGIVDGLTLRDKPLSFLQEHFGKAGRHFFDIARGIDERPVVSERIRKSIGAENTFDRDITSLDDAVERLAPIVDKVWSHCDRTGDRGRTVTLKVKYSDFSEMSRRRSLPEWVGDVGQLRQIARDLAGTVFPSERSVRLVGVSLSNLNTEDPEPEVKTQLGFEF